MTVPEFDRQVILRTNLVRQTASGVLAVASRNSLVARVAPPSQWQGTPPATVAASLQQRTVQPTGGAGAVTPTTTFSSEVGSGAEPTLATAAAGAAAVGGLPTLVKVALLVGAAYVVWKVVT